MAKERLVYIGPNIKGTVLTKNKTYIKKDGKFLSVIETFLDKNPSFLSLFISTAEFAKSRSKIADGKSIYNHKINKALEEYKKESEK
ncbi:hypothetical protein [Ilyobacter polytropus]|uniref:Uncharacterized protein n=1 Tax=Ilyobacter polytropus (strain ATCC 51220 / DSM 2926 / LMG 16218 / CuHBu1) TaxID=572544 RepID=E3HBL7_ILYPC|nr:hypothetical protein [Ilyobacter polytropus]ADO83713.1 hypothetical protein Ilyop_1942 [Ilyobacter polytropus DSM 2926]